MAGLIETTGLVETSSQQQFQSHLHHLQPPGLVKQEYELNYAGQQLFENPAEPGGSLWGQDVKVEDQKNFSQERQVEEGPVTSQYVGGGHQRQEYSYVVGGLCHYRDNVEYKDGMYNSSSNNSSMAGQQQYSSMESQHHL